MRIIFIIYLFPLPICILESTEIPIPERFYVLLELRFRAELSFVSILRREECFVLKSNIFLLAVWPGKSRIPLPRGQRVRSDLDNLSCAAAPCPPERVMLSISDPGSKEPVPDHPS